MVGVFGGALYELQYQLMVVAPAGDASRMVPRRSSMAHQAACPFPRHASMGLPGCILCLSRCSITASSRQSSCCAADADAELLDVDTDVEASNLLSATK